MSQMPMNPGYIAGGAQVPFGRSISMTSNNVQIPVQIEREKKRTSWGKICRYLLAALVLCTLISLVAGFVCFYTKERRDINDLTDKMRHVPVIHERKPCKPCDGRPQRLHKREIGTIQCCKPRVPEPTSSRLRGSPMPETLTSIPSYEKPIRAQLYLDDFHPGRYISGPGMQKVVGWGRGLQQSIRPRPNSHLVFNQRDGTFCLNRASSPQTVQIDVQLQFIANTTGKQTSFTNYGIRVIKEIGRTKFTLAKRTEARPNLHPSTPHNYKAAAGAVTVSIKTILMPGDKIYIEASPAKLIAEEKLESFFSIFEL